MSSEKKSELTGVRAKLAAFKAEADEKHVTLPASGVSVTIPGFINHGHWMRAQRQAKNDIGVAQAAFVAEAVRFEGEKLTLADIRELLPSADMLFLIGEVFADSKEEGDEAGKPETVQ